METYEQKYHRIAKRVDSVDLLLNEVVTSRYLAEIEMNHKKNIYYQSIVDYMLYQRAQMSDNEYPILTESGFNQITDVDGVKTIDFHIPSWQLYYNQNYKTDEITYLELKQTKAIKTYNYWIKALQGDISKRIYNGEASELAMINGLRKEIDTLIQIAKGSKVIVALTIDKTIISEGYETSFYQYDNETKNMLFLKKHYRKEDFKNELRELTK